MTRGTTWYIMDKKWAEENNVVDPTPVGGDHAELRPLHANGTGPFIIESHQPGVRTVFKANPNWWGKVEAQPRRDRLHADRAPTRPASPRCSRARST